MKRIEKYIDFHVGMEERHPGITLLILMLALLVANLSSSPAIQILMVLICMPTGVFTISFGSDVFWRRKTQ